MILNLPILSEHFFSPKNGTRLFLTVPIFADTVFTEDPPAPNTLGVDTAPSTLGVGNIFQILLKNEKIKRDHALFFSFFSSPF